MNARPQPIDQARIWTLHRWYILFWVVLGLLPMVVAGRDDPGATKYWSMGLPVATGLCYAIMRGFPDNRVLRPQTFLWVLVVALGAMSYTREGGATVFVATLPQFWFLAKDSLSSIRYSGLAAAATVLAAVAPQGWSPELSDGNTVATVIAYAMSVPLGLSAHRFVAQRNEQVRVLGTELESTQLQLAEAHRRQGAADERERLAREIHDTLAQGFASIVVLAEAARSGLEADAARSAQQLRSIEQTARENLAEARVLVGSAPQSGVAPGSVARVLRRTLDRFTEDTGLTVDADLPDVECDQQTRIALLRCTQESLANIRKHAGASTVGVVLAGNPYGVELEITDDGRGFVVEDAGGFGLVGMRKRMDELGGEFTVTSSIGDGTRVLAVIPTNGQV
ncbi:sensor histidine kinase [Streptomyces sp. SID3343]|uniref:sensor histidine kinase n=1 Tax=Streptomyces sp. SID3343 TaxID=2690260 RepID=UPI00136D3FD5|nr:sensor histidine kinase [Streptomyces sp. SID3343]MYW05459.1 sensor histidine kinase [Streptomyces sp. SID3343]